MIALAGAFIFLAQVQPTQRMPDDAPLLTPVVSAVLQVMPEGDGGMPVAVEMGAGVCLNEKAHQKLNTAVSTLTQHIDRVEAENTSLKTQVDAVAANPPLALSTIAIASGVGLVVGAVVGIVIYGAVRK